jgi:hypothetical protein
MIVRRSLEESAATLVEEATGIRPELHSAVSRRLMLLPARVAGDQWSDVYGLMRRAARAYEVTSEVLHSNRAFGDVSEHLVQEWEQTADEVEIVLSARGGRTRSPTIGSSGRMVAPRLLP